MKKYLYKAGIILSLLSLFSVVLFYQYNTNRVYSPRESTVINKQSINGAIDYFTRIKANQETGEISIDDVLRAQKQVKALTSRKSTKSTWKFRGPNNIGGRTRALLFDNEDANVVFAGGVSGGLWKSTTRGQYWEQVTYEGSSVDDFANLAVVSIVQNTNGDIYFGTGEAMTTQNNHGTNIYTPLTMGAGIWKSVDRGQTFKRLESTWGLDKTTFAYVNKLAYDKVTSTLFAATAKGLKSSIDGGETWQKVSIAELGYDFRFTSDVKVGSDGTVIASIGNNCFIRKKGSDSFELRSGMDESEGGQLISNYNVSRLEFDFSPQNPNIIVCAAAKADGSLKNIYRSIDGGDYWFIIGEGGSSLFQPFGNQGIYDMCISINPKDSSEVFVGGFDIWYGKAANTGNLFAWSQVSINQLEKYNPLYVHADQHTIVFDPSDANTFFVGSDGGVSRCYLDKDGEKYQFKTMNKNFGITQFYSVGVNGKGQLLGGTQDNGSILMDLLGANENVGREVMGGDGGQVVMSSIMPSIAFTTIYYGGLWRNNDAEFGDWNTFYAPKIIDLHWAPAPDYDPSAQEGSFITPIALFESDNDKNTIDTIRFVAMRSYPKDTTIVLPSYNINKAPIRITLKEDIVKGDTIEYVDYYESLFAFGMAKTVWLTRSATNWNKTLSNHDWWQVVNKGVFAANEYVTQLAFSKDGDHLFFSTNDNRVFRLSNLNKARTYKEACYDEGNPITELTQIGGFSNRTVTGLSCDPNDIDKLIVTLGNYGNDNYVYLCTMATRATKSLSKSNFINITGNMPKAPAYCSLFEMDENAGTVLLGTDMGVFTTDDIMSQASSTVVWEAHQENLGPVPTHQIKQQTGNWEWTRNKGMIYIGTHGLGMYENQGYLTDIDDSFVSSETNNVLINAVAYPNPCSEFVNVAVESVEGALMNVSIYNISGQKVYNTELRINAFDKNNFVFNFNEYTQGIYLIGLQIGDLHKTIRIIKQ